jgi:phage tail tape-measure protein
MSSSVGSVFGGLKKRVSDLGGSLAKLKRQSADIGRLQNAQSRLSAAQGSGNAAAIARYSAQVEKLSSALRNAGVDTSRLSQEQARLTSQIGRTEAQLGRMSRMSNAFTGMRSSLTNVGSAFGNVRDNVTGLATKMGVLGTAAGYLFKTQFVDTAAEFEKLQTILKTLEGGDVNKAKQNFGWISDFAAKTPFDLKTVTEAFVKLRAYGIDPIKGDTLLSLGDTASAMGKSVMDAVEAIADAVTGENERLKEFGIKAAKEGGKIIYSYTDKAGKQRQKAVDASNRDLIRSTLTAIWNEKYAGAMEEQSRTWQGMMSNMGDQWTRFTSRVMASGVFEWMKGKLGGALEEINLAAEDGRLQKWAEETGKAIKEFFEASWELGKSIRDLTVATADFVGGWKNLGIIISAVALAPLALSVVQLGQALWGLTAASWGALGPWGLLAAAFIGASIAVFAFRKEIREWMDSQPGWVQAIIAFSNPLALIPAYWDKISAAMTAFKIVITVTVDWAIKKINELLEKLASIPSMTIGGVSVGDITSTMLDVNPLTGPARLIQRQFTGEPAANTEVGGVSMSDLMDKILDFNPITGPGRFMRQQLMPATAMPAPAPETKVNQSFQINVTAPSADPVAVGNAVQSAIKEAPLYDSTSPLGPR